MGAIAQLRPLLFPFVQGWGLEGVGKEVASALHHGGGGQLKGLTLSLKSFIQRSSQSQSSQLSSP